MHSDSSVRVSASRGWCGGGVRADHVGAGRITRACIEAGGVLVGEESRGERREWSCRLNAVKQASERCGDPTTFQRALRNHPGLHHAPTAVEHRHGAARGGGTKRVPAPAQLLCGGGGERGVNEATAAVRAVQDHLVRGLGLQCDPRQALEVGSRRETETPDAHTIMIPTLYSQLSGLDIEC